MNVHVQMQAALLALSLQLGASLHNAPALLLLQREITTPPARSRSFCIMQRGVHQLKIIMESLCAALFIVGLRAEARERDCFFAYQEQNQHPLISILISSATPRDLILGFLCVLHEGKKLCTHIIPSLERVECDEKYLWSRPRRLLSERDATPFLRSTAKEKFCKSNKKLEFGCTKASRK